MKGSFAVTAAFVVFGDSLAAKLLDLGFFCFVKRGHKVCHRPIGKSLDFGANSRVRRFDLDCNIMSGFWII